MRKFIAFISILILGFAIVNVSYLWVLSYIDWDFSKTKEAYNFKDESFKILVFGNSTALDGVNTEMLSNSFGEAYNFSVGGASLESNYIQFQDYLSKNKKPEKVLLLLSSCHVSYNKIQEINPIVEYYYMDPPMDGLSEIPLFKFRWLFIENIKKALSSNHRSAKIVSGQLRINKNVLDTSVGSVGGCDSANYDDTGYQFVGVFSEECKALGIDLLVFEMPCWKKSQNECPDEVVRFKNNKIQIYNLNSRAACDSILNPSTDWLSENHLNFNGSVKLTRQIEYLILSAN